MPNLRPHLLLLNRSPGLPREPAGSAVEEVSGSKLLAPTIPLHFRPAALRILTAMAPQFTPIFDALAAIIMTAAQNQNPAADTTRNHSTPVAFSPLFAWPPRPKAALLTLTQRWFTLSRSVLFLTMAVLMHKYLLPVSAQMKSLTASWVALVFLSNFLFMLLIAGGLHLFLFTFRLQGRQLKYDHRESHDKGRKFTFHHEVYDNMFRSRVSGSTTWSIYEMLCFHGIARRAIPTVTLAKYPIAFLLWLLAMPIITSSHFYAIHRLLHWTRGLASELSRLKRSKSPPESSM